MNKSKRSLYDRSLEKTPEQIFVNMLRKEFELSPAESKGILELAKNYLYGEIPQILGKIRFMCAGVGARHGKPLKEQDMVRVDLTIDNGVEDLEVNKKQGAKGLRQLKILRITEDAYEQGGLLTQEDIGRILQVTDRTVRDNVKELIKDGNTVHTRGNDQDIGRGVSHKSRIVDLYLSGYTYDEIMKRTRHSGFAIKRYVCGFGRLLLLLDKGLKDIREISRLLGYSEKLTKEYLDIYKKYKKGDKWPKAYVELIEQLKVLYPAKKKVGGRWSGNEK